MFKRHRSRILSLPALFLILAGCSTQQSAKISALFPDPPLDTTKVQSAAISALDSIFVFEEPDTALTVQEIIMRRMEEARLHYQTALDAQVLGDSSLSAQEFEQAIEILNSIGEYSEAEENEEFNDLTQTVIEDYERYIASIDSLSPESSVFALREKLNQVIESIDISGVKIPKRVFKDLQIPFTVNELVERNVAFYLSKGKEHFELWLYRAGKFIPHMKRIFKEESVPEELVYLSMMESGLNPNARSWMRAVGLWQFMKGTGRLYGLDGNWWYDERRDFEKSTRAAARYLRDLHEQYDDWYLAIAAYNSGAGRINRGIRRSGSKDFWAMRRHLPRETRNFVPQYLAVAMMAMRPEEFGFQGIEPAPLLDFDEVTIDDCVDLTVLAKAAETDVETMRELNPELLQWCTPPGYKGYSLRIPIGKAEIFLANYAQIPDDQKRDWVVHKVRRGDTLSEISKKYGISMDLLIATNKIRNKNRLSTGQTIVIPIPKDAAQYVQQASRSEPNRLTPKTKSSSRVAAARQRSYEGKSKVLYRIRRGDTIGHIAEWFGVRASQIRMWNDIPYGSIIREDQDLAIWVSEDKQADFEKLNELSFEDKQALIDASSPEQRPANSSLAPTQWVRYKVRAGDSLGKIASTYRVTVDDLQSWNGLTSNTIYAGQALLIAAGAQEAIASEETDRSYVLHKIRRGESLSTIAKQYEVSISDIKHWNNLKSSRIYAGQELRIYTLRPSDQSTSALPAPPAKSSSTF